MNSLMTFIYFHDLDAGKKYITEVFEFEPVHDFGFAYIWKFGNQGFLSAVQAGKGYAGVKIPADGEKGVLISLTVDNAEEWYKKLRAKNVPNMTELEYHEDIELRGFFIKGPEKYNFEIQEFMNPEMRKIFLA